MATSVKRGVRKDSARHPALATLEMGMFGRESPSGCLPGTPSLQWRSALEDF